ncbi:FAD/NAD(P)-binding protein [Salmonella enterica]|nr:FAD/NAD(P)-binding protein [Salmonella enterica]
MFDIVIIGLGATGVSLLSHLQEEVYTLQLKRPEIAVFNPSHTFATGKAFGDADHIHRVNTPSSMMSVSNTEPFRFEHWLQSVSGSGEHWPTRLQFSDFIQQTYKDIYKNGILNIKEFHYNVISVNKDNKDFVIRDENGNTVNARKIVMCLGAQPSDMFPEFNDIPGFINHFSQYDPGINEKVIIAGSSLTAIDAFRYIHSKNDVNVHCYSRSGYAPTCLTEKNTYTPVFLNWRNILTESAYSGDILGVFTRLLRKEFYLLRKNGEFRPAMTLLKKGRQADYFSLLQKRAEAGDLPCQDTLVSTRSYMPRIWNAMNNHQRNLFLSQYGALWSSWRHPVPYEIFSELSKESTSGKIKFHKMKTSPVYLKNKFTLNTHSGTLSSGCFWDATGDSQNLNMMKSPLLKNLMHQNLIENHPCGGININPLTFQCKVKNNNIPGLYNIGPLNKGCLFSTNAFWFNNQCTEIWAKQWAFESTERCSEDFI